MWTLLGLVVGFLCGWWVLNRRSDDSWSAPMHASGVQVHEYELGGDGFTVTRVEIGLPVSGGLDFVAWPESWPLKLAARLGLMHKLVTGDPRFDDEVFVAGDDPQLLAALRADAVLRESLRVLVAGPGRGFRLVHVMCRSGSVRSRWRRRQLQRTRTASELADGGAALMQELAARLPHGSHRPGAEPALRRGRIALAIAAGLLGNAVVALPRAVVGEADILLDWPSRTMFLATAALLLAVPLAVAVRRLAGSTRLPELLGPLLWVGGLGALGSAFHVLRDVDVLLDFSTPTAVSAQVRSGGSPYSRSRRVDINDGDTLQTSVVLDRDLLYSLSGDREPAILTVHRGALGLRWTSHIEPGPMRPLRR